jgi:hypothetical protein
MTNGASLIGAEVGRVAENPRSHLAIVNSRYQSEATSVTAHCHAAPASRLTREYQGDHRRQILTSTSISAAP